MTDTAPLIAVTAAWAKAWNERAAARLIALWDKSDPDGSYLAAGQLETGRGAAVIGLIQRRILATTEIVYRPGQAHLRRLAPDLGLAFFPLAWSERPVAQPRNGDHAVGGKVRATMLMRRHGDRWLVFHYAEAPLAPLLELQAYYEAVAADGLDAIRAASLQHE